jgi:hypothetical protein
MERTVDSSQVFNEPGLHAVGLTRHVVASGVSFVHRIMDSLDHTLVTAGETRLSEMVELANLSAIIGNLLRTGIANASDGGFVANGPHKYPDLLSRQPGVGDLEIKVALESNKPKGHLVKPGPHLTCRYVLGAPDGTHTRGKDGRGDVVWIWEIRAGVLSAEHFSVSNTDGDSGKTAVINAAGFSQLQLVYCSLDHFPAGPRTRRLYEEQMRAHRDPVLVQGTLL